MNQRGLLGQTKEFVPMTERDKIPRRIDYFMWDVDGFVFRIVESGAVVKHQGETSSWTHGT